jgi:TetR/AcrR family transcriptional regulator
MGISERKEREREQRRIAIVDAAEKVFFVKGVDSATMDEIADVAELSKGTLYLYYKSKIELYLAVCEKGMHIMLDQFRIAYEKPVVGREKLRNIGLAYFNFAVTQPDYFKATSYFELTDMENDSKDSVIAISCHNLGESLFRYTLDAIRDGMDDGSIHEKHNPNELAVMMWSSMRGVIQLYNMRHRGHEIPILNTLTFEDLVPHYINLLLEGLRYAPVDDMVKST